MSDDKTTSSPEQAVAQQGDSSWPRPGEEGYVHPDGTPQSRQQLADNQRAAADRAAAGSTVHGAPLATPGPNPGAETEAAEKRAEAYSGATAEEAAEGLTRFVQEKTGEAAEQAARRGERDQEATPADRSGQETATDKTPKTRR